MIKNIDFDAENLVDESEDQPDELDGVRDLIRTRRRREKDSPPLPTSGNFLFDTIQSKIKSEEWQSYTVTIEFSGRSHTACRGKEMRDIKVTHSVKALKCE
jgi:hypothetical protein